MTFQQLYYLLEVEKTGSFSGAAKNLFVTQSTISNAIASLEKEIGKPLFIRGKKALILSPVGEDILAHAKRICESHRYITTGQRPVAPMVRIGSVGFSPVYSAFSKLIQENLGRTDIQFALHDGRGRNFEEDLLAYRLDVAIAKYLSPALEQNLQRLEKKGFALQKLITLPAAVCIGPGHKLYEIENFPMEALKEEPAIELTFKPVSRSEAVQRHLPINSERSIVTSHDSAKRKLLMDGVGYSVTHMPCLQDREASPLRYVPIPGLTFTIYAYYDSSHRQLTEVARFMELLKEETKNYLL